jgi:DNA helicase II / ATP-dependent DNA helicase PcrA
MNWSGYQQEIFRAVAESSDSLLIEAVAGSGKTSTIVEAINYVPDGQSVCFVAFNKSIAEELGRRVTRKGAVCATLHSVGWNAWRRSLGWDSNLCKVEHNKTWGVMKEVMSWPEREKWGGTTARMVGLGKQVGVVPLAGGAAGTPGYDAGYGGYMRGLVEDTDETWEALADHYSVEWEEVNLELVRRVLARSIELGREQVDFDDMLYLPVVGGVEFDKWDVVFVDEAQDLSGIQIEMVSRMVKGGP